MLLKVLTETDREVDSLARAKRERGTTAATQQVLTHFLGEEFRKVDRPLYVCIWSGLDSFVLLQRERKGARYYGEGGYRVCGAPSGGLK